MFGAPLFLFGTLAAGIPVLIHLLARRKSLPVEWPTLRFLEESHRKTARRRRIEQLLLMLLRAGVLFLLAVGLAQPVLRYASGTLAGSTVVIAVDNSLSMDAKVEARSSLGDGIGLAHQVLDGLPDSTFVGVVPVVKDPMLGLPGLGRGVEGARACLKTFKALPARGSLSGALRQGLELARSQGASHQEIYLLTDCQMNAFPLAGEISERAPNAVLTVMSSARHSPVNLTVEKASVFMPVLARQRDASVSAAIFNSSNVGVTSVVALEVNGARRSTQEVSIPAGGRTEVSFLTCIESAGLHRMAVSVGEDALAGDNASHAALFVPETVHVLVAAREAEQPPFAGGGEDADPGYFLVRALDPLSASGETSGAIKVDRCAPETVASTDLMKYAAVFLVAERRMGGAVRARLDEYLTARGTVVVFGGGDTQPLDEVEQSPSAPDTLAFVEEMLGDALLRRLPGMGVGPFRAVRVDRLVRLEPSASDEVVLKTARTGLPVLVRTRRGPGIEYTFAVQPTPASGNLVLRGLFPLLVQQIVYASARAGGVPGYAAEAGESVHVAGKGAVDLVSPSGRIQRLEAGADGVDTGPLLETGVYTLQQAGAKDLAAYIVVNPAGAEGELKYLAPETAAERLSPLARSVFAVADSGALLRTLALVRKGLPVYDYILALVVALVVFETFFAARVTPTRLKILAPAAPQRPATRPTTAIRLE